jgi:hypothetical protein
MGKQLESEEPWTPSRKPDETSGDSTRSPVSRTSEYAKNFGYLTTFVRNSDVLISTLRININVKLLASDWRNVNSLSFMVER